MYIWKNYGFRVILQNAGVIVSILWFLPILINKAKWSKIELKIDIKSIKMVQMTWNLDQKCILLVSIIFQTIFEKKLKWPIFGKKRNLARIFFENRISGDIAKDIGRMVQKVWFLVYTFPEAISNFGQRVFLILWFFC